MIFQSTSPKNLITCETVVAIVVHVRELGPKGPCYSGGADTKALCGADASWDTRIPVTSSTCRTCLAEMSRRRMAAGGGA